MSVIIYILIIICELKEGKTQNKTSQCIKSARSTEVIRAFQHSLKYYKKTGILGGKLSRNTIN